MEKKTKKGGGAFQCSLKLLVMSRSTEATLVKQGNSIPFSGSFTSACLSFIILTESHTIHKKLNILRWKRQNSKKDRSIKLHFD